MSKVSDKIDAARGGNRKKVPIKPRHRLVLAGMEKGLSITKAMIAASYAPSTVNAPALITNTQSWQALMDEQIPESHLALRHRELLDKRQTETRIVGRGKKRRVEIVDLGPETTAVSRGLEMAYKIRGKFVNETPPPPQAAQVYNLFYQPTVQAQVRSFEEALKLTIRHGDANMDSAPATPDTGGQDAGGDSAVVEGAGDAEPSE